jgi:hypothetical protein
MIVLNRQTPRYYVRVLRASSGSLAMFAAIRPQAARLMVA